MSNNHFLILFLITLLYFIYINIINNIYINQKNKNYIEKKKKFFFYQLLGAGVNYLN